MTVPKSLPCICISELYQSRAGKQDILYLMNNRLPAELLAEFLGTMVLIMFGDGVVAMVVLFDKGGYTNITLAWGLAVTMGIYLAGKISGAHLNPAVTLAMAVFRDFPWKKVLPYSLVQIAGGFAGAALVYWNYRPQFLPVAPTLKPTADVFTTC